MSEDEVITSWRDQLVRDPGAITVGLITNDAIITLLPDGNLSTRWNGGPVFEGWGRRALVNLPSVKLGRWVGLAPTGLRDRALDALRAAGFPSPPELPLVADERPDAWQLEAPGLAVRGVAILSRLVDLTPALRHVANETSAAAAELRKGAEPTEIIENPELDRWYALSDDELGPARHFLPPRA